ncbi:MAG: hypothetical protein GEU97_14380 [Actinophytocola sp.]|nr:hypothetical protein [Actinophytocola sp.]
MTVDAHIQAINQALRADHEDWVATVQQWADAAAARGDTEAEQGHLAHVARLRKLPQPWATSESP